MKFDLATLCYTVPGLRWLGNAVTPKQLFRVSRLTASVSIRCCPHTRRFLEPLERLLGAREERHDLRQIAVRYLTYRRYMNYLEKSWHHPNVSNRLDVEIIGQAYLDHALQNERGVILLSGHAFGFNRLIGPVLSRRGYSVIRPGGVKPEDLDGLKSDGSGSWDYLYLGDDSWQRLRALKTVSRALGRNAIAHLLVVGQPQGEEHLSLRFCEQRFYLKSEFFKFVAQLSRPALPCFALCDMNGKLIIHIHSSLPPDPVELAVEFTKVYESYLCAAPEFVRFWRRWAKRSSHF